MVNWFLPLLLGPTKVECVWRQEIFHKIVYWHVTNREKCNMENKIKFKSKFFFHQDALWPQSCISEFSAILCFSWANSVRNCSLVSLKQFPYAYSYRMCGFLWRCICNKCIVLHINFPQIDHLSTSSELRDCICGPDYLYKWTTLVVQEVVPLGIKSEHAYGPGWKLWFLKLDVLLLPWSQYISISNIYIHIYI